MGDRLMVGLQTLTLYIGVRVPVSQPKVLNRSNPRIEQLNPLRRGSFPTSAASVSSEASRTRSELPKFFSSLVRVFSPIPGI